MVEIAKRDADLWLRLKVAILDGDSRLEHTLACQLCGLPAPEPGA